MARALTQSLCFLVLTIFLISQAAADVCAVHPNGKPKTSCNDPAYPKCVLFAVAGWKCIGRNATPCEVGRNNWSCSPPQSTCHGDGSTTPRCR